MSHNRNLLIGVAILAICAWSVPAAFAQAVPGGTLDPLTIPKYVTPLVIPPVMNDTTPLNNTQDNEYDIAVREFYQQILPGGIWSTLNPAIGTTLPSFPATKVWSYGPEDDPLPNSMTLGGGLGIAPAPNSQFNYPAYTICPTSYRERWIRPFIGPTRVLTVSADQLAPTAADRANCPTWVQTPLSPTCTEPT